MNARRANWAFLITIIAYILLALFGAYFFPVITNNIVISNLAVEIVIFIPVLVFMLVSRENLVGFWNFRKMKPGTVLMTGLFTFLTMPVMTLFNLLSQFWTKNEISLMMEEYQMADMPFWQLWISLGVVAPVFEEVICRGAFYRSYRRSASAWKAMLLSAVVFACLHMNFNQAAYAVVVGVFAVLLVEATGSLWSSIIYHSVINSSSCLLMYFAMKVDPQGSSTQAVTWDILIMGVGIYLIWAAATLPFAFAVLAWMGKHEGREGVLTGIWRERKWIPQPDAGKDGEMKKDKLITVPLVLALILCLLVMTGIFSQAVMKLTLWLS